MAAAAFQSEAFQRSARMLRTALGPSIAAFLEDPAIVEVMLNPDGRLWVDRLSGGLEDTGATLSPADGERIVRLVAHHVGAEVHTGVPPSPPNSLGRGSGSRAFSLPLSPPRPSPSVNPLSPSSPSTTTPPPGS